MKNLFIALCAWLVMGAPLAAKADTGWYVDITGGVSGYGNSSDDQNTLESQATSKGLQATASVDDDATAWTLGGGYQFNRYFALEADYVDLGNSISDLFVSSPINFTVHQDTRAKGETLEAIGMLPLSEVVSLFAKGGVFDYILDQTADSNVPIMGASASASGTSLDLGVGVDLRFGPVWAVRAGLTQYRGVGDDNTTGKSNLGLVYAQLVMHF